MSIQPDIQYIANPGGNGDDALAFGVRFEIAF
ncbi:MAG: carbohydrate porin [Planctomycetota bacterium]|jgi:carbohydrate-selective porin OprB